MAWPDRLSALPPDGGRPRLRRLQLGMGIPAPRLPRPAVARLLRLSLRQGRQAAERDERRRAASKRHLRSEAGRIPRSRERPAQRGSSRRQCRQGGAGRRVGQFPVPV